MADERGSIVAVTDASGAATAINSYDEYGIPGAGNRGRFGYTGQKWIAELGMYDYKARMYSPSLGRFLQTDPIGYGDGLNWYAYVGNDPVNATDPSGTEDVVVDGLCGLLCQRNWRNYVDQLQRLYQPSERNHAVERKGERKEEEPRKNPCAKASSKSGNFVDATLASEDAVFSKLGSLADAAVVVGFAAAPLNPVVAGVLITGGKVGGAAVLAVQGSAAVADAVRSGNYGRALSLGAGQLVGFAGGRLGARVGARIFGNQQIRNGLGQFAGKRANSIRQAGQTIGNSAGSQVCPN